MTPMSFTSFRDRLDTASGFQSAQYRELEFVLGYKRPGLVDLHDYSDEQNAELKRRLAEPSLVHYFHLFLQTQGATIPPAVLSRDPALATEPNEAVQDVLFDLYTSRPDLAGLFESMTDFDEGLQEWRYRHVKLVERTIGQKHGTGGSAGVEFLKQSLFLPMFPDLWAIRHRL